MQPHKEPFIIGFFGVMAIASSNIILLYASTFGEEAQILLTAVVLLIVGLFMAFLTVGIKIEPFSIKQFSKTFLWTCMSFGAMLVINRYVPFTIELTVLSPRYFGVLMGVAEECFFRIWICGMIYRMLNSSWIAIGASSLIWSVYHISRYGGNFNNLMLIFICGCILGASFIYSRQADNTIIAHGIVNYLAIP